MPDLFGHTHNTFKSAFTVIPTPIAKLIINTLLFTAALYLLCYNYLHIVKLYYILEVVQ